MGLFGAVRSPQPGNDASHLRALSLGSQALVATLIGLIAFSPLSPLVRQAEAAPPTPAPVAAQAAFTFSFDIPNDGALDLYHDAFTSRDHISNSLYALRNSAIEDLLNTRKALKILVGGTQRARELRNDQNLSFDVPGGVIQLYMLGNLGHNHAPARNSSPARSQGPLVRGVSTEATPEISSAVQWLGANEPEYNPELRFRLLKGLAYISGQLVKYDQELKFYQKDFFDDRAIGSEYYDQEIKDWAQSTAMMGGTPDYSMMYEYSMKQWLTRHGMDDVLSVLAGHREYLLDRYHLLAIDVDGKPLYKRIYEAMVAQGFPSADMVMRPVVPHLPSGTDPIPLNKSFEQQVDKGFDTLAGAAGEGPLRHIFDAVNDSIDQAFLISLDANTDRLDVLTQEIDYSGDRSSKLLELAHYDDLWDTAQDKYSYLNGIIDFKTARTDTAAYFERVATTKRHIKYAAYGVGIGLGVVATVLSFGEAGVFLGIGARAWMIGSGLVLSAQAVSDYVDSKSAMEVARGMYLGTTHIGTDIGMRNAILVAENDYKFMLACLLTLGAELAIVGIAAKGRVIVQAAGRTFVRLTSDELELLRGAVRGVASRAEALAPLGRAMLAAARNVLGMVVGDEELMSVEQSIGYLSSKLRMAAPVIRARLEANPMVGALIRGYGDRVVANPKFLQVLIREEAVQGIVSIITEKQARGDHFKDELGNVAIDMATGMLATAAMVWIAAPTAAAASEVSIAGARRPQTIFDAGYSGRERLGTFMDRAKSNFIVGFAVNAGVNGVAETIAYAKDPDAESVSDRAKSVLWSALYGGTFMAVSSNARYQFMGWLDTNMGRLIASKPTAKIILTGLSVGNNYFGGWHYVKLAKWLGVQKGSSSDIKPVDENNADPNRPNDTGVTGIQLGDAGGAFLRIDGDDAEASYMFDFLDDGQVSGPQPQ